MKTYAIKEWFATLQGEGALAGRRAVFLRFAGCNVWNGRPEDRHKGKADCKDWCDTDFADGQKMTADEIVAALEATWQGPFGMAKHSSRMVVITGGEPTLQLDEELVKKLHEQAWFVAIETNGSIANPALRFCDHVCVSPKRGMPVVVTFADELKVVLPGGWSFGEVVALEAGGAWCSLFVQPQDATDPTFVGITHLSKNRLDDATKAYEAHVERCVEFIKQHPGWRLSVQTHKYLGLR